METKRCYCCKQEKPISEFGKDRRNKDGLNGCCKVCKKKYNEMYRRERGVQPRSAADVHSHCEYMRKYRETHDQQREREKKYAHDYRVSHPGYSRKHSAKHRAKNYNCGGEITEREIMECLEFFEYKCAYSGLPLNSDYHLDHIVPLSKGGKNEIHNIVPCTMESNLSKSTHDFEPWYKNSATFSEQRHNKIKEWAKMGEA